MSSDGTTSRRLFRVAPEAWPLVVGGGVLALGLAGVGSLLEVLPGLGAASWAWAFRAGGGAAGLFAFLVLGFFRDPPRTPPPGEGWVVAPADGRVLEVSRVEEPAFLGGPAIRIATFLSLFDVHVQRAPVSGTVAYRSYRPGRFLAAWDLRAGEENERAELGIQCGSQRVLVRQIAGVAARRVVLDPREGEPVAQGERIGIIRFGSRVDLFVPLHWEVRCREGDRLRAGESVVARMAQE